MKLHSTVGNRTLSELGKCIRILRMVVKLPKREPDGARLVSEFGICIKVQRVLFSRQRQKSYRARSHSELVNYVNTKVCYTIYQSDIPMELGQFRS